MDDTIVIDAGVPVPPKRPPFGKLLRQLEVHAENKKTKSSFAVYDRDQWNALRNAVANAHRDTTMRFMTRKMRERDLKSRKLIDVLRVWRIE